MEIAGNLRRQLELMNVNAAEIDVLREKDGVTVARVNTDSGSRVLKYFSDPAQRREISNYRLLRSLGVPELCIFAETEEALLMEDMEGESRYRLGVESDMADVDVARMLAQWYRKLHESGMDYARSNGEKLYSELDYFTQENIAWVMMRSETRDLPVWKALNDNFDRISATISSIPLTLTYNDFYYTNLAVARDGTSAMMFDYNLLGRGTALMDIRNVTSSLSTEAGAAFMEAYGSYDFTREKLIDDVVSPVVTLTMAYKRKHFPSWAEYMLTYVKHGYIADVEALLKNLS